MGCADARLTSAVALGHDSRAAVVFLQEYRPTSGYYQKVACKCAQAFAARVIVSLAIPVNWNTHSGVLVRP
jgi:hypothetical protein